MKQRPNLGEKENVRSHCFHYLMILLYQMLLYQQKKVIKKKKNNPHENFQDETTVP